MDEYTELEFKYRADEVKLKDFVALMKSIGYVKSLNCASWDVYYTKNNNEEFQRFRHSDRPELTKKTKVKATNSWERVESDLPLDPARVSEERVAFHVGMDGYKENFRIYKVCDIFYQEHCNYVHYIVFDENMKESGRFIEVEINKDKIASLLSVNDLNTGGLDGPKQALNDAAKALEKLGLTSKNRMKKNLFELFKKEIEQNIDNQ